jgi:hypothetical protein
MGGLMFKTWSFGDWLFFVALGPPVWIAAGMLGWNWGKKWWGFTRGAKNVT